MAPQTVLVTPATIAQAQNHWPTLAANFNAGVKCAMSGPDMPPLGWIVACVNETPPLREVAVTVDGATPCAVTVVNVKDAGRIEWLIRNPAYADAAGALNSALGWVKARYGQAWGVVENPAVVASLRSTGHIAAEGGRMEWS